MKRWIVAAAIAVSLTGCGEDVPQETGAAWSTAQAVGPSFTVMPYFVTVHAPGQQIFVAPRVTWARGTAVAVWSDLWTGTWATRLGPDDRWTPPAYIARPVRVTVPDRNCLPFGCTPFPSVGEQVDLVASPEGAAAVWQQTQATDAPGLWSAVFVPGGAWSSPRGQSVPPGWFAGPVAKSAGERAIVAWEVTTDEQSIVWAQRFAGSGLDVPTPLRSADRFSQRFPAVDIDAAGTAVVVWSAPDGIHARWSSAAGWGPDRTLAATNATCPVVAVDGAGGAIVAWREISDPETVAPDASVVVARLRADTGWEARESSTNPSFRSGCPAIASAPSGDAVLAWANAGANRGLWARPLRGASAGQVHKVDDVDGAHEVRSLRVVIGGDGAGYGAWVRARSDTGNVGYPLTIPPTGTVWTSRFVNGGAGWDAPAGLQGPSAAETATAVDIAVGPDGRAIAFWFVFADQSFTPWSARTTRLP